MQTQGKRLPEDGLIKLKVKPRGCLDGSVHNAPARPRQIDPLLLETQCVT